METIKETVWKFLKLHRRLEMWACVALLVFMSLLLICNIGIPEEIVETRNAAVITESGELRECEVRITGSADRYLLKGEVVVDELSVWLGDRLVVEFENGKHPYSYSSSYRYTGILCRAREVVLAELDYGYLFPEEESMRCVISVPAGEAGAVRKLLKDIPLTDDMRDTFSWLTDEA